MSFHMRRGIPCFSFLYCFPFLILFCFSFLSDFSFLCDSFLFPSSSPLLLILHRF